MHVALVVVLVVAASACAAQTSADEADQADPAYRVVVPGVVSSASTATFTYRVKPGDTTERVAEEFDTTVLTLEALNEGVAEQGLEPGSLITVAPPPPDLLPCDDILVPLNKEHAIPASCAPDDLIALGATYSYGSEQLMRREAAVALTSLLANARGAGHEIVARSTYRSYAEQETTFAYWVEELGLTEAERTSARPGHSEHQLGTTADVISAATNYELLESFGATPGGRWLAENAARFGFVITYPSGEEHITGYAYEPWHVRFVGVALAQAIDESGLTPHEYLMRRWILGEAAVE